jgi:hypothetical protein
MLKQLYLFVPLLFCCFVISVGAQQKRPVAKKDPITGGNFRWTTYTNGSADLSYSLRNNTKNEVTKVNCRVIFYGAGGEPVHYEDGYVASIPAGLAVMETVNIFSGGTNLYHSTVRIRVEILSYEGKPQDQ